jgi:hypothetical protein
MTMMKMTTETSPRWRDEKWVHETTGIALATLRNDRSLGRGLPYYKIGKSVRYSEGEVLSYFQSRRVETRESR